MGTHQIQVIINDTQGLYSIEILPIEVYQPPKFAGNLAKQIDILASNKA
jgi:hypothetical protein